MVHVDDLLHTEDNPVDFKKAKTIPLEKKCNSAYTHSELTENLHPLKESGGHTDINSSFDSGKSLKEGHNPLDSFEGPGGNLLLMGVNRLAVLTANTSSGPFTKALAGVNVHGLVDNPSLGVIITGDTPKE